MALIAVRLSRLSATSVPHSDGPMGPRPGKPQRPHLLTASNIDSITIENLSKMQASENHPADAGEGEGAMGVGCVRAPDRYNFKSYQSAPHWTLHAAHASTS